jgi:hypothetical protein
VDEFIFDALNVVVIDIETQFERPIGDPPFLVEQCKYLGEDVIEGHSGLSLSGIPLADTRL